MYSSSISWPDAVWLMAGCVPGAIAGPFALQHISDVVIKLVLYSVILLSSIKSAYGSVKEWLDSRRINTTTTTSTSSSSSSSSSLSGDQLSTDSSPLGVSSDVKQPLSAGTDIEMPVLAGSHQPQEHHSSHHSNHHNSHHNAARAGHSGEGSTALIQEMPLAPPGRSGSRGPSNGNAASGRQGEGEAVFGFEVETEPGDGNDDYDTEDVRKRRCMPWYSCGRQDLTTRYGHSFEVFGCAVWETACVPGN